MNKQTTQLALTALLTATIFQPLTLNSAIAQTKQEQSSSSHPTYQQAKKELDEDVYVIYRITERIARANGVDQAPWRVVAVQEYNINAFASDVNKISLYTGLLDQLGGDASAIACVVGHEMAHHTKRHIAMSQAERANAIAEFEEEAQRQVQAEAQDAQQDATGAAVLGELLGGLGGQFIRGWGGDAARTGGAVINQAGQQRLVDAELRINQIVEEKTQALNEQLAANSRKHEFEADEYGYKYMARAGFDPQGCVRMLNVLARTPGAEFDTTHPATPKRIERMKELIQTYPPQKLADQGDLRIRTSEPLTFQLSKDQQSLRINSRHGGSAADDIDRMFD
ncbi:MAG: M48 family metallopeptidase [Microcystaceae cyanobacterium]